MRDTSHLKEYREKLKNGEIKKASPKNPVEKWEENKTSLRLSINAFCYQCIGEVKEEIRNCTAYDCPLFVVRPYQRD